MNLVEITWRDAFSSHEEIAVGEWQPDMVVVTVGFFLAEDERFVHVAQELVDGERVRCVTHIPVRSILGRVDLMKGES